MMAILEMQTGPSLNFCYEVLKFFEEIFLLLYEASCRESFAFC